MTKRERVMAALMRQPVDRPPVSFWRHVPDVDHGARGLADAMLAWERRWDLDFIKVMSSGVYCVESSIRAAVGVSLFDSLVGRDVENRLVPQLALSWKLLDDTTWQFKLRKGVLFHDGEVFYASRDRLGWTPRGDQWMLFQDAVLK